MFNFSLRQYFTPATDGHTLVVSKAEMLKLLSDVQIEASMIDLLEGGFKAGLSANGGTAKSFDIARAKVVNSLEDVATFSPVHGKGGEILIAIARGIDRHTLDAELFLISKKTDQVQLFIDEVAKWDMTFFIDTNGAVGTQGRLADSKVPTTCRGGRFDESAPRKEATYQRLEKALAPTRPAAEAAEPATLDA